MIEKRTANGNRWFETILAAEKSIAFARADRHVCLIRQFRRVASRETGLLRIKHENVVALASLVNNVIAKRKMVELESSEISSKNLLRARQIMEHSNLHKLHDILV